MDLYESLKMAWQDSLSEAIVKNSEIGKPTEMVQEAPPTIPPKFADTPVQVTAMNFFQTMLQEGVRMNHAIEFFRNHFNHIINGEIEGGESEGWKYDYRDFRRGQLDRLIRIKDQYKQVLKNLKLSGFFTNAWEDKKSSTLMKKDIETRWTNGQKIKIMGMRPENTVDSFNTVEVQLKEAVQKIRAFSQILLKNSREDRNENAYQSYMQLINLLAVSSKQDGEPRKGYQSNLNSWAQEHWTDNLFRDEETPVIEKTTEKVRELSNIPTVQKGRGTDTDWDAVLERYKTKFPDAQLLKDKYGQVTGIDVTGSTKKKDKKASAAKKIADLERMLVQEQVINGKTYLVEIVY